MSMAMTDLKISMLDTLVAALQKAFGRKLHVQNML
jgi:hypothetical protein